MEETQRFLRYVMPGALFFIEALLLLLVLLGPEWTFLHLSQLITTAQFGGALAAFLSLGALGFLFSIFHHWAIASNKRIEGGVDHGPVIARLRNKNLLYLSDANTGREVAIPLSRRLAWVIFNAIWHQRASKDHRIKGAIRRTDKLADIVHAIGTARWAYFFAVLVTSCVAFYAAKFSPEWNDILRFILMLVIAAILFCTHECSYRRTSDTAEKLAAEILEDALTKNFWKSGKPVRTFVDLGEHKKRDC